MTDALLPTQQIGPDAVVLVWVRRRSDSYWPTVASLRASHPFLDIVIGGPEANHAAFEAWQVSRCPSAAFHDAVIFVRGENLRPILVVSEPVVVPPGFLDRATLALTDDLRLATLSFLSNASGSLSVPQRNVPSLHQVGPHDEVSITQLLRGLEPSPAITPIAAPIGPVTLISALAFSAVEGMDPALDTMPQAAVVDLGLRASERGFINAVDGGTYYTRAFDLAPYEAGPLDEPGSPSVEYFAERYPAALLRLADDAAHGDSPLGLALQTAVAKIRGLRIIIDGRDIGPKEMGTQVQILSLVRELALRNDVESVQLALPGPVPAYAAQYLASANVSVFHSHDLDMSAAAPADVLHRPSQPSSALPFEDWRLVAPRIVVTLQDLIAYQVGAYFDTGPDWMRYRSNLVGGVALSDAVVVISEDTRRHVAAECLPVDSDRLFVVPNGTDHFSGNEPELRPQGLVARGFVGQQFALVMGTNYGHKNRDLAIRAWQQLRETHPNLALVLAGAFVPNGSSRRAEAMARASGDDGLFVVPDVTSPERNWLLRHASLVLYPTSAEGFGLVPFEAARFGTPTVGVRFSPVADFNSSAPIWADNWSPLAVATAAGKLLDDQSLAAEQVSATLKNGAQLTWADTAQGLVRAYRTALSRPAHWQGGR